MTTTLLLDTPDDVVRWLRADHPHISRRNLRQWADRGHITRHPGDLYNAVEVAGYLERRSPADRSRSIARRSLRSVTTSETVAPRDASPHTGG